MEYTVNELAALSGVSARTIRYYDKIGLLKPERIAANGYRVYADGQADRLQAILLYRELAFPLEQIAKLLDADEGDRLGAMRGHLRALKEKRARTDRLIATVQKTILSLKGEVPMTDREKFEGFKKEKIRENEAKYGAELREKYGEEAVNASNEKFMGMSEEKYHRQEALAEEILSLLKRAKTPGDPDAQRACDKHREWLCLFWKDGMYSKAAHRAMGEMYVQDERFRDHYEAALGPGGAEFLRDAINLYAAE